MRFEHVTDLHGLSRACGWPRVGRARLGSCCAAAFHGSGQHCRGDGSRIGRSGWRWQLFRLGQDIWRRDARRFRPNDGIRVFSSAFVRIRCIDIRCIALRLCIGDNRIVRPANRHFDGNFADNDVLGGPMAVDVTYTPYVLRASINARKACDCFCVQFNRKCAPRKVRSVTTYHLQQLSSPSDGRIPRGSLLVASCRPCSAQCRSPSSSALPCQTYFNELGNSALILTGPMRWSQILCGN